MSKETTEDLIKYLKPFPQNVKETTLKLREFIWDLYPDSNEIIYDNYNALAIGFSTSDRAGDAFVSIAVYSNHVNFGFNRGSEIVDSDNILEGDGSLYRRIKVTDFKEFPQDKIKSLMQNAYSNSLARLKEGKQKIKGQTVTKSISPIKRRPSKE